MTPLIQKILLLKLLNNRGSILLLTYFVIIILFGLGAAFLMMGVSEAKRTEIQHKSELAFYIAEAGIERAIYDLKQEYETGNDEDWSNGIIINGDTSSPYGPSTSAFYDIYLYGDTDPKVTYPFDASDADAYQNAFSPTNNNHYQVKIKNVLGGEDVWIRSTGEVDGVTQTIQVYAKIVNVSPWNNAIFGGAGATGEMVNGRVNVFGSVHILGEGLATTDNAIVLGGTTELVGNNYESLDQSLRDKVPDLPTTIFNGETVETLSAELRVKRGRVSLSGNSTVGQADSPGGPLVKETIDSAYVTDGYTGTKGATNVHSDNGTDEGYDLGDVLDFPSLDNPHPLDTSGDYYDYFSSNGLVLTNELDSVVKGMPVPLIGDCNSNCVEINADGTMRVEGLVYISGTNDFSLTAPINEGFEYTGKGTILVNDGNVTIDANLVTAGDDSFPTNILGVMTPNTIFLGSSAQRNIMGLFFAGGTDGSGDPTGDVTVNMQTNLVGTIIANLFNLGENVPSIFQVPFNDADLPPGIIANETIWYANIVSWQKCDSHTATCGGVN